MRGPPGPQASSRCATAALSSERTVSSGVSIWSCPESGRRATTVTGWPSISADSGLPVRATVYDWDDRVVADYAYRELRLNPPLTRADFDAANPEYGFPAWRLAR